MKVLSITLVLALGLCGCAGITASKAKGPVPNGVRIYPPKVLFLVDAEYDKGRGRTSIVVVPDAGAAYDLRPEVFLAKSDFKVELEDGMLASFTSNVDTTAVLSLLKTAGELGAKAAAGQGVSARDLEGSYGLKTGIYVLGPGAILVPLPRPAAPAAHQVRQGKN